MEIIIIQTQSDFLGLNDIVSELDEFEIRMPNNMQQMYLSRNEIEDINESMNEFIEENDYEWHKWYDYHLKGLVYKFNKGE